MTEDETLAALGFPKPEIAGNSETAAAPARTAPEAAPSTARADVAYPSRRSLRESAAPVTAATGPDSVLSSGSASAAVSASASVEVPTVAAPADTFAPRATPAAPGSRRAAREAAAAAARAALAVQQSASAATAVGVPVASAAAPAAPSVAAPAPAAAPPAAAPFAVSPLVATALPPRQARPKAATAAAPRPPQATAPSRPASVPLRKRLTAAGTMAIVGGLFVSLGLPAYASADFSAPLAESTSVVGQELAIDTSDAEAFEKSALSARDGYGATSAADLRRLYRDAIRQQNLAAYLASGAKEMGDDYPWAAELSRFQGGGLSPLRYFYRECVDFVAWRLNRDAGSTKAPFKYDWGTLTPGGGNASSWKSQWERHGWKVSNTPKPGWVAWFPGQNHVAYVSGVLGDGSVALEEYNWGTDHTYNQRVISASDAVYLAPPPR